MTALSQDEYPIVQQLPPVKFEAAHRATTVTGGHLLMANPGQHVRARRTVWRSSLTVLVGVLLGALLIVVGVGLWGQASTAQIVPGPSLHVSPAPCTFPQDDPE